MATATVSASKLNLRSSPNTNTDQNIIKKLSQGDVVEIVEKQGEWLKVSVGGQVGFVSSHFVQEQQDAPPAGDASTADNAPLPTPPPAPATGTFKFVGKKAVAPDGTPFATRFKLGVFNTGTTTIGQFIKAHKDKFAGINPSHVNIMQAVSENEGKLEAINTWDNAFLTFGIFQWTAGADPGPAELPALVHRIKQGSPGVFQTFFGQFGLDTANVSFQPGVLPTGQFKLNGVVLSSATQKQQLRTLEWAYRFWLAGQDDTVRQAQIEHAMSRVDLFYRNPQKKIGNRFIADYVTSEFGVALILDQHVNRPGHVPGTIARAVAKLVDQLGSDKPDTWTDAEERRLLDLYIQLRAQTSMTNSTERANVIRKAVQSGLASDKRGSFQG